MTPDISDIYISFHKSLLIMNRLL